MSIMHFATEHGIWCRVLKHRIKSAIRRTQNRDEVTCLACRKSLGLAPVVNCPTCGQRVRATETAERVVVSKYRGQP